MPSSDKRGRLPDLRSLSGTAGRASLPPGLIFEIALQAGIEVQGDRPKREIHCPFHDDRNESAFLSVDNVFYCSVCTASGGWSAKTFAQSLGVPWRGHVLPKRRWIKPPRSSAPTATQSIRPPFTPANAEATWSLALAQALSPSLRDVEAIEYLRQRGLLPAMNLGAFGFLDSRAPLHPNISWWPDAGYRIVAPLFDQTGRLVNIQARSITHDALLAEEKRSKKKVRFPANSVARATCFASSSGLEVLRGELAADRVLVGEGLTDHLALTLASPIPVLSAPGTGNAASCIGSWASGCRVYLALDQDQAGENARNAAAGRVFEMGGQPFCLNWPCGSNDACEVLETDGRDALAACLEPLRS